MVGTEEDAGLLVEGLDRKPDRQPILLVPYLALDLIRVGTRVLSKNTIIRV